MIKAVATQRTAKKNLKSNAQIADRLRHYAYLLKTQGDDRFRIRAYIEAADQVEKMDQTLQDVYKSGGINALIALPAIGRGIAGAIGEILTTGRWSQLDRLTGDSTPEQVFRTLPGIGPVLANRFADQLDAQTLEELETLLSNPDMSVPGLGQRRRKAILAVLAERLKPIQQIHRTQPDPKAEPSVSLLLEADSIYRQRDAAGDLRKIAPLRFNPDGKAWLPVLHLRRDDWHLTLLYSNTARAHDLDKTKDWVVVFFHRGDMPEAQRTIVTEKRGALVGRRVVRGREEDCARYYADVETETAEKIQPPPTALDQNHGVAGRLGDTRK